VFIIRSFIAEPFKIPSGSMMPTLLAGDYILVNKYTYGLRVPVINNVFFNVNEPTRGDVAVFHFPPNPSIDYIKRIVGLPGDEIQFIDKRLIINGKKQDVQQAGDYIYEVRGNVVGATRLQEQLGDVQLDILIHDDIPSRYNANQIGKKFLNGEAVVVPQGKYFAMGDNRDNSSDGRVWGFVPDENLVGKAFFIWFNFDDFGRIGNSIH
jgi:signal peptidase I